MPCAEDGFIDDRIPDWAIKASSELQLGSQLCTRDGRIVGNAHIIEWCPPGIPYHRVLTDAGTKLNLTEREIGELFYPPRWVSDVNEVKRKFSSR